MEITFPDGTIVRAGGLAARDENADWRTFGLYLDPQWSPDWPSALIDWADFGLPREPVAAAQAIQAAFGRAQSGEHVEVGCLGGLGRTGTLLACMATMAGVPAVDAVAWVRAHYQPSAVETEQQADWVLWFAAHVVAR